MLGQTCLSCSLVAKRPLIQARQSGLRAIRRDEAYRILGLHRRSSKFEIREAYLVLIRQFHPDVSLDEDATEKSVELNEAYEVLLKAS